MRIVISGTVGVGKTTITKELIKKLESKGYKVNFLKEETALSPYLTHFYREPAKWAFIAQLDFLMERFKQWLIDEKKRQASPDDKVITVYDRHFIDDYLFAELHSIRENISQINSIVYQAIYKELLDKLAEYKSNPDYFFLLKAELSTIVKRLHIRGRKEEKETNINYWKELYNSYYIKPKFIYHFKKYNKKVITIDTENRTPEQIVDNILDEMGIK